MNEPEADLRPKGECDGMDGVTWDTWNLVRRVVVPPRLALIVRGGLTAGYNPHLNVWHLLDQEAAEILRWLRAGRPGDRLVDHLAALGAIADRDAEVVLRRRLEWCILRRLLYVDRVPQVAPPNPGTNPLADVYWICTQACNLRCTYCYQDARVARPDELTTSEALDLVDQVVEAGAQTLVLTGGEPFSRRDLLTVAARSKEAGLRTTVITNGHFVTPRNVGQVADVFDLITVSLDHMRPEHHERHRGEGSWRRAYEAIRLLLDAGARVDVSSVLSRQGFEDLDQLLRMRELPLNEHKILPWTPMGRAVAAQEDALTPMQLVALSDRLSAGIRALGSADRAGSSRIDGGTARKGSLRMHCGTGLGEVAVDSEGWVYPCKLLQDPLHRGGNVRERRLRDIYASDPALQRARERVADRLSPCSTCLIKSQCGGGCRGIQASFTGDFDRSHPLFCSFLRRSFESRIWESLGVIPAPRRDGYRVPERYTDTATAGVGR